MNHHLPRWLARDSSALCNEEPSGPLPARFPRQSPPTFQAPRNLQYTLNNYNHFAPDLASDRYYRFLDKYFLALQIPLGILLYLIGETQGQGFGFVIYGIFVRAVFVSHSTWLINSACHKWGYRNFGDSADHSTNLWWAALLTYGEGWHNNHHAYPKSARAGLHWWEIDPTWYAISLLKAVGLAKKVYIPAPWQPKPTV